MAQIYEYNTIKRYRKHPKFQLKKTNHSFSFAHLSILYTFIAYSDYIKWHIIK
jgi:hypothetical protein